MNDIKIFENPDFGSVRITEDTESNQLLFCAMDVCTALGYSNGRDAVYKHVEKDDVVKCDTTDSIGRIQQLTYVTESGLYSLIFGSKQERAKKFKHWVTSDVLLSIRKTGRYNIQSETLNERIKVKCMFADWSAKFLNLNEASKLGIAQKIGKMVGLDDVLPQSVNAGTEKPITHAATDLLKSYSVGISAQAFNRMLEIKGVVKHATRPGKHGKVHSWYVITPAFDRYGQNQQDPKFQQQTQIRWYDATFNELLTIVGLNKQTSLNLK